MSLNWKEINLILEELELEGAQIQSAVQSAYDVIVLRLHKTGKTRQVLISLSSGACRIHETFRAVPKSDKPLRFAQFLSSKIVNGWIIEAHQLGDNRIIFLKVKRHDTVFNMYIRLWSNAANFIVTDEENVVLDAMRRLPKKGEVTGKIFSADSVLNNDHSKNKSLNQKDDNLTDIPAGDPPQNIKKIKTYTVRDLQGDESFNKKIDDFYASQGGALSLENLREQLRRNYEGSLGRINAALARLKEKEASFADAERFKNYGDLILSNLAAIKPGDKWFEINDGNETIRIELNPQPGDRSEGSRSFERVTPAAMAGKYYEQYRKAKNGLGEIQREIEQGEQELKEVSEKLDKLLSETNPLILAKLLKQGGTITSAKLSKRDKSRPGLSFKKGDWLILVGRDARENDELLRRHVKGNDTWLHARDYHGSYVFVKQRAGKSIPLDILLDAGNLAVFYSKGRNNGEGDLFYTQVKYLRRAKDGPKGLVIPTQEKNLHVKLDDKRLRSLEGCKV